MDFKRYHNPSGNPFAPNISILFNKGRYIEFSIPSPPKYVRELRLLFGPKVQQYSPGSFAAGKDMIPRVLRALELKNYAYSVTEDWI